MSIALYESRRRRPVVSAGLRLALEPPEVAGSDDREPWERWLTDHFPRSYQLQDGRVSFARAHREFWAWVWGIDRMSRPAPFLGIWSRGFGKSTHAETAVVYLGCENLRRYGIYVSGTQYQADQHVQSVAAMLEAPTVARHYPVHSERLLSKFNQSKGWRVNRVRTAGGLTVDAVGLDKAVRGARMEEERPDFIVFDDVDSLEDTPRATGKKLRRITHTILPAGNLERTAVLFVQNLIIAHGVMARLVDGTAGFLKNRILSGPYPAIDNLTYEMAPDGPVLTGGTPTWDGMPLDACQRLVDDFGLLAFLREGQHEVQEGEGALWDDDLIHQHRVLEAPESLSRVLVAIDPQVSSKTTGSETGIIVGGVREGHAYILFDGSGFYTPDGWAQKALKLGDLWKADAYVGEVNNGGDLVEANLRHARGTVNFLPVHASRGKYTRAELVIPLYQRGRVHHVGYLLQLEKQLTTPYDPDSLELYWDRMDALVWLLKALLLDVPDEAHFDRGRHVYQPRELARPRYVAVNPRRIEEWLTTMAQGNPPEGSLEEWGELRPLMVKQLYQFARRNDRRGQIILQRLQEYDRAYGTVKEGI